jgi:methanogenic corrinoid protein MtbC1
MIPGPKLTLGGAEYTVPPLPFIALKKHKAFLGRAMRGEIDPQSALEDFETMADCVYQALKRNHPDLTQESLDAALDMRNIAEAFQTVMQAVGFKEKPAGE